MQDWLGNPGASYLRDQEEIDFMTDRTDDLSFDEKYGIRAIIHRLK